MGRVGPPRRRRPGRGRRGRARGPPRREAPGDGRAPRSGYAARGREHARSAGAIVRARRRGPRRRRPPPPRRDSSPANPGRSRPGRSPSPPRRARPGSGAGRCRVTRPAKRTARPITHDHAAVERSSTRRAEVLGPGHPAAVNRQTRPPSRASSSSEVPPVRAPAGLGIAPPAPDRLESIRAVGTPDHRLPQRQAPCRDLSGPAPELPPSFGLEVRVDLDDLPALELAQRQHTSI